MKGSLWYELWLMPVTWWLQTSVGAGAQCLCAGRQGGRLAVDLNGLSGALQCRVDPGALSNERREGSTLSCRCPGVPLPPDKRWLLSSLQSWALSHAGRSSAPVVQLLEAGFLLCAAGLYPFLSVWPVVLPCWSLEGWLQWLLRLTQMRSVS